MDTRPLKTNVCVHSPVTEYSLGGGYFTSYAIHLTSNNPCFNRPNSHVRRRYSEFVRLKELLFSHHPTITPPSLPPKGYFYRFEDAFIDQRMKGLQKFLNEVLATPVYLSDKSLHLFLQSNSSMSKISEECFGDIPAPPLIDSCAFTSSYSENSSKRTTNQEAQYYATSLHHLVLDDCKIGMQPQRTLSRTPKIRQSNGQSSLISSVKRENTPISIPKRNGSLDSSAASSPSSSPSSCDTSYSSSSSDRSKERHVSFDERVKVAVVTHYGISVLRP